MPSITGRVTSIGRSLPCTISRMRFGASASGVDSASYCSVRCAGFVHRSGDIVWPCSSYQSMTEALGTVCAACANRRGRRAGFSCRSRTSVRTWASRSSCHSACCQSIQVRGESWQYALLLPRCVRPNSSPAVSIGTPADSSRVPSRFRMAFRRVAWIAGSSVGPSVPWLNDRLVSAPSRFCSPLPMLCLTSYETRSRSVNPSCAVMKLTLASGPRSSLNVFDDPARRVANPPAPTGGVEARRV